MGTLWLSLLSLKTFRLGQLAFRFFGCGACFSNAHCITNITSCKTRNNISVGNLKEIRDDTLLMGQKGKITPYKFAGKNAFGASFFHPVLKKRVTRGLGTKLESAAKRICEGLEWLSIHPKSLRAEFKGDPRAWDIFFRDAPAPKLQPNNTAETAREIYPNMAAADIERAIPFAENSFALLDGLPQIAALVRSLEKCHAPAATFAALAALLDHFGKRLDAAISQSEIHHHDLKEALKIIEAERTNPIHEAPVDNPYLEAIRKGGQADHWRTEYYKLLEKLRNIVDGTNPVPKKRAKSISSTRKKSNDILKIY